MEEDEYEFDEFKVYHIKQNTDTGETIGGPVALTADTVFIDNWDQLMLRSPIRWVPVDPQPEEDV